MDDYSKVTTKPTKVSGRNFSKKQIQQIQDTVSTFGKLSRWELAQTICEHLNWNSPKGRPKIDACLRALQHFENRGYFSLPSIQLKKKSPQKTYIDYVKELIHVPLKGSIDEVYPLELQLVKTKDQRNLWNGYVERYHYLGYKQPFGPHLRYFLRSPKLQDQYLGCLLFSPAAWALRSRDEWIGWSKTDKNKRLSLIINNSRFLIFPWIDINNLASQALAKAAQQAPMDWFNLYGYRPVLLETFVDPTKYEGTCYKAANWQHIGNTTGRGRAGSSNDINTTSKKIFVYPITAVRRIFHSWSCSQNLRAFRNTIKMATSLC